MKRCITYCVYTVFYTGLLKDTSTCEFIWVLQKQTRLNDLGRTFFLFGWSYEKANIVIICHFLSLNPYNVCRNGKAPLVLQRRF